GTEKALKDLGAEVQDDEKKAIEDALASLREAVKANNDKDAIVSKTEALAQASAKLMERVYAKKGAEGAAGAAGGEQAGGGAKDGDVVDAEFTEVKDKKA
ncbi:MAG: Hsp70 family protein, partial [Stenotrophobium sp.]